LSDLVSKRDVTGVRPVSFAAFGGGAAASQRTVQKQKVHADELSKLREQARKEGFAEGLKQGTEKAQREAAGRVAQLDNVLAQLSQPLAGLDQALEDQIVRMIITVAKYLVRREIQEQPGEIASVVRDALSALPVTPRNLQIHLNPEDAEMVREYLHLDHSENKWTLVEDIRISRGGCRLETEDSMVDATLETRITAVVAQVMGGQRAEDRQPTR
jgi:flagellar assembly protein FliH